MAAKFFSSRRGALLPAAASLVLALNVLALDGGAPALSQTGECARLQQSIAAASGGHAEQFQAAAERQRSEVERTSAYANSIGCSNRKFLFFGSDPPPQCGQIESQIARMRANLQDLQSKAGGGDGGRGELVARYNAQCQGAPAKSGNLIDALLGGQSAAPDTRNNIESFPLESKPEKPAATAGYKAVCVRTCDGSFFPVSYSAGSGGGNLTELCRALCPNADVGVYTYPNSGEIEQAVSSTGARYMDSSTALKYRTSFDSSCSCRRRGQTWASALASAEARFGNEHKSDILVTAARSEEMSRPLFAKPKPTLETSKSAVAAAAAAQSAADDALAKQAAAVSREDSGIAGGDAKAGVPLGADTGKPVETVGADGIKRRVRIIDPEL